MVSKTDGKGHKGESLFPETRWTLVVKSADGNSLVATPALSELCEMYWQPLYIYLRRMGKSPEDSEDCVQDFFEHLLKSNFFDQAEATNGKLRYFLLKSLKNFSIDQYKRDSAAKRGGGHKPLSIDRQLAENGFLLEEIDELSPDKAFDRQWAYSLLNKALDSLRTSYRANGKTELFEGLSPLLSWNVRSRPQSEVAKELNLSDSAMRVALHRLRAKFRDSIREQVAETIAGTEKDIDEEIRELFAALS